VIKELKDEIKLLKSKANQSALSQATYSVPSTSKKVSSLSKSSSLASPSAIALVSQIDKKAKRKKNKGAKLTSKSKISNDKVSTKASVTKSSKKKVKQKLTKKDKIIKSLRAEKAVLIKRLSSEHGEVIREQPVIITKTVLIKEKVNRKKLSKLVKKIPFKRTKKVSSMKTQKGKAKLVLKPTSKQK